MSKTLWEKLTPENQKKLNDNAKTYSYFLKVIKALKTNYSWTVLTLDNCIDLGTADLFAGGVTIDKIDNLF